MAINSGVARGVHVGSFAPNLCTCTPILYMFIGSCLETKVFIGSLPAMGRG